MRSLLGEGCGAGNPTPPLQTESSESDDARVHICFSMSGLRLQRHAFICKQVRAALKGGDPNSKKMPKDFTVTNIIIPACNKNLEHWRWSAEGGGGQPLQI